MKLKVDQQIRYDSTEELEGIDATISAEDMNKLWDMLQSPYKDSIGAIVREYTSNSFDSHAEASFIKNNSLEKIKEEYPVYLDSSDDEILELKNHLQQFNNDAVKVSLLKDETGWYWSSQDFGVGLSTERIKNVFTKYLKSTKTSSNTVIGSFGIGSKSGLSYNDIFYITTRYLGIEYLYLLRKGEIGPRLEKIYEIPTEERNGTEIKIYLKSNDYSEIQNFKSACRRQLLYFDNVYFDIQDFQNDFKILKTEHWLLTNQTSPFSGLHLCIGKVAYPLDWNLISTSRIDLNIALYFEIGELDITQTREDVKYTPRTIKAIEEKIELVKQDLIQRYNELNKECKSIKEFYDVRNETPFLYFSEINSYIYLNADIIPHKQEYYYKPFKDAGLNCLNLPTHYTALFFDYKISGVFRERFQSSNMSFYFHKNLFRLGIPHDPKISKYIKHKESIRDLHFVRKNTKKSLITYITFLKLKETPKDTWRKQITIFQKEIDKIIIENSKKYSSYTPDKEYLKTIQKEKEVRDKSTFKITIHRVMDMCYNSISSSKHTDNYVSLDYFKENYSTTFICQESKEQNCIEEFIFLLYKTFTKIPSNKISFIRMSATNLKKLKNLKLKNVMTPTSFINVQNNVFIRTMTYYKLLKEHSLVFDNLKKCKNARTHNLIKNVFPYLHNDILNIKHDIERVEKLLQFDRNLNFFIEKECYTYAKEYNVFDEELEKMILKIYNQIKPFISEVEDIANNKNIELIYKELIYLKNKQKGSPKNRLSVHDVIYFNQKYNTYKNDKSSKN